MVVSDASPGYGKDPLVRYTVVSGAISGLLLIPISLILRWRAVRRRKDLVTDRFFHLFENILFTKALLDAMLNILLLLGLHLHDNESVCEAVGFLYQLEETCTLILISRLAYFPFRFMVAKEDCHRSELYFRNTLLYMLAGGLLFSLPLLGAGNRYGRTYPLCWIAEIQEQFYAFYSLVVLTWAFALTCLFRVVWTMEHRRTSRLDTMYHGSFFRANVHMCMAHLLGLAFIIIYSYIFRIASRAYTLIYGRPDMTLVFLEIFTIAFRGTIEATVSMPKDALLGVLDLLTCRRLVHEEEGETVRLTLLGEASPVSTFTEPPPSKLEDKKIFVSTYNMGECKMHALGSLADWIPLGMDIYVIGVQECMTVEHLGRAIHEHVGGPNLYVMYHRAIGSTQTALGYHGMIALWVLARREDVRGHHFLLHKAKRHKVARGRNLGVTVTQNKGGIGMAFRYYDTTFACVNVHLASDLKGRSRLGKRIRDSRWVIKNTNLWREEDAVDVVHQHHVVLFLGDMNYRMSAPVGSLTPMEVLRNVAHLSRSEASKGGRFDENWRGERYGQLLNSGAKQIVEQVVERRASGNLNYVAIDLEGEEDDGDLLDDEKEDEETKDVGGRGVRRGGNGSGGILGYGRAGEEEEDEYSSEDEEEEEEEDSDISSDSDTPKIMSLSQALSSRSGRALSQSLRQISSSMRRLFALPGDEDEEDDEEGGAQDADVEGGKQKSSSSGMTRSGSSRGSFRVPVSQTSLGSMASITGGLEGDIDDNDDDKEGQWQQQQEPQQQPKQLATLAETSEPLLPSLLAESGQFDSMSSFPQTQTWDELVEFDELWNAMRAGDCFYHFLEAPIRFPPSYRRVKGAKGYCGDYTDVDILAEAYSITVKEKPRLNLSHMASTYIGQSTRGENVVWEAQPSLSYSCVSEVDQNSSFSRAGSMPPPSFKSFNKYEHHSFASDGGGSLQPCLFKSTEQASTMLMSSLSSTLPVSLAGSASSHITTRVPSYTDRILVHTFPDMKNRISLGPYELCDALTASDHRPVSTVINAKVKTEIRGVENFDMSTVGRSGRGVATVHDAAIFQLSLNNLSVALDDATLTPPSSGHSTVVYLNKMRRRRRRRREQSSSCLSGSSTPPSSDIQGGSSSSSLNSGFRPPPGSTVLLLFPLENEDVFGDLRRPMSVAEVVKNFAWLTSRQEHNPFKYILSSTYEEAVANGLTMVSCVRPEYGLHAFCSIRGPDGSCMGQCVLALTDAMGTPKAEQLQQDVALTSGGALAGHMRCDIRVRQLALNPTSVMGPFRKHLL